MSIVMRVLFVLSFIFLSGCSLKNSVSFYTQTSTAPIETEELIPDATKEEIFNIGEDKGRPLDILIVMDPSSSMKGHLDNFGKSLSSLLSVIHEYDWQIAFTTADHGDHERVAQKLSGEEKWEDHVSDEFATFGKLMPLERNGRILNKKILNSKILNYEDVFYHTLSHGSEINCNLPPFCQKYLEQPLRSLKSAIERSILDNTDLFRDNADFVSIIITNEDERNEDSIRATSAENVIETFNKFFGSKKQFLAFNIIVKTKECLNKEVYKYQRAQRGYKIEVLAQLTNGANLDICTKNYGSDLQKISQIIKNQVEKNVILQEEPHVDSVKVEFLNSPKVPWSVSGKRLAFKGDLAKGSQILVRYQAILE